MKWVKVNSENNTGYPPKDGKYIVRMSTGSIAPKIIVMESDFTSGGNMRPKFSGAFDWNYVIEWLDESPSTPIREGVENLYNIPLDVEGSNLSETGWPPSEDDKKWMPLEEWEQAINDYKDKNSKVIFSNIRLNWESCDCGDGYGCNHKDWVYEIDVLNGDKKNTIHFEDGERLLFEKDSIDFSLPRNCTVGDFYRACQLSGIELQFTEYGKSLLAATHLTAGEQPVVNDISNK